ncbi:MAG: hypothetical protein JO272_15555 [Pseudonocardiales bacterium]|nr:hypothetical protein [Pseudonocardiales bacterium]
MTLGWIGAHGGEGITAGRGVRARAVWVDLNLAFPLPTDHRQRVVADGLDLTGRVPGMLKRWVRGSRGEWYGVVWVRISDGAGDVRMTLEDQLVPAAALSPRPVSPRGITHAPSAR